MLHATLLDVWIARKILSLVVQEKGSKKKRVSEKESGEEKKSVSLSTACKFKSQKGFASPFRPLRQPWKRNKFLGGLKD